MVFNDLRALMEPLWSPVVATGGNQAQTAWRRKRPKQAKTVAVGCHQLLATFHGKEGVDRVLPIAKGLPPCGWKRNGNDRLQPGEKCTPVEPAEIRMI